MTTEEITVEEMNRLTRIAMDNPPKDSYNYFTFSCYLERTKKVVEAVYPIIKAQLAQKARPELRADLIDWITKYKDVVERHALAETPSESADYLMTLLPDISANRPDREKIARFISEFQDWDGARQYIKDGWLHKADQIKALFDGIREQGFDEGVKTTTEAMDFTFSAHEITSLLVRRVVGEASKKTLDGAVVVRFNAQADKDIQALILKAVEGAGLKKEQLSKYIDNLSPDATLETWIGDKPIWQIATEAQLQAILKALKSGQ